MIANGSVGKATARQGPGVGCVPAELRSKAAKRPCDEAGMHPTPRPGSQRYSMVAMGSPALMAAPTSTASFEIFPAL